MQVEMRIKNWKVAIDEKTKIPKVKGEYSLLMQGTEIASQSFNGEYSSKEIPFSGDLTQKVIALEKEITAEIQNLIQ